MAHANQRERSTTAMHSSKRMERINRPQKKVELEKEVAKLNKMLDYEERVHEILEHASHGHVSSIPSFLPPKMKELLAELAMVEEEITRLEREISNLQQILTHDQKFLNGSKSKQWPHESLSFLEPLDRSMTPHPRATIKPKWTHERLPSEARALFFINQAIKGDYISSRFARDNEKIENSIGAVDHKEGQRDVRSREKLSRKSGIIEKPSMQKIPPRHSTGKPIELDPEIPFNLLRKSFSDSSPFEENIQKLQPNKLSESIVKCLVCIFMRLIRTSRAMELEKSGPITRSTHPSPSSRSFRSENALNLKASSTVSREMGQQDPYGIFAFEDSLPRDIGPYKNFARFTSSSLDVKNISSSIPLLRKLRVLMSNLYNVDLRFLTYHQKLAFWINMYNACIMHGFLQYGLPSNSEKVLALMNKAVLNIGGNQLNALAIEHFILRQPTTVKEVHWYGEKNDKDDIVHSIYGLEYPEPNVMFALSCGSRSSPAVRIYTADGISAELEKSKLEYLQASIVVTTTKRLMVPKLLLWNMANFAKDMDSLLEWTCNQLPASGSLKKSMVECLRRQNSGKISDVNEITPYDFEFQYLLAV
ncbi:uncharacterized protein LOC131231517 [Magnolia sinica]|uniref:uncharacterized protein LOC131231517 n=1 Tax=Magnolia sinica TaxID=86752 RepID=UPI0026592933|nr:uncharacterized protein LOC131231517 [Magnolia sinica]